MAITKRVKLIHNVSDRLRKIEDKIIHTINNKVYIKEDNKLKELIVIKSIQLLNNVKLIVICKN